RYLPAMSKPFHLPVRCWLAWNAVRNPWQTSASARARGGPGVAGAAVARAGPRRGTASQGLFTRASRESLVGVGAAVNSPPPDAAARAPTALGRSGAPPAPYGRVPRAKGSPDLALYPDRAAREGLAWFGRCSGLHGQAPGELVEAVFAAVAPADWAHDRAGTF